MRKGPVARALLHRRSLVTRPASPAEIRLLAGMRKALLPRLHGSRARSRGSATSLAGLALEQVHRILGHVVLDDERLDLAHQPRTE